MTKRDDREKNGDKKERKNGINDKESESDENELRRLRNYIH